MYSDEYNVFDVTLSVHPHRALGQAEKLAWLTSTSVDIHPEYNIKKTTVVYLLFYSVYYNGIFHSMDIWLSWRSKAVNASRHPMACS
jgi:orotate phosphoribosyltransferase-like protein